MLTTSWLRDTIRKISQCLGGTSRGQKDSRSGDVRFAADTLALHGAPSENCVANPSGQTAVG